MMSKDIVEQLDQAAQSIGTSRANAELFTEAMHEIERLRAAAGGGPGGEGTEWFWRIVDAHGLADVPSDEGEALRLILRRGGFAGGERGGEPRDERWQDPEYTRISG